MTMTKEVTLNLNRQDEIKVYHIDKKGTGGVRWQEHPTRARASVWSVGCVRFLTRAPSGVIFRCKQMGRFREHLTCFPLRN